MTHPLRYLSVLSLSIYTANMYGVGRSFCSNHLFFIYYDTVLNSWQ